MTVACVTFDELESKTEELVPIATTARSETKRVVARSKSSEFVDIFRLSRAAYETLVLRYKFIHLANCQQNVIGKLVAADFTATDKSKIKSIAGLIDELVNYEREFLSDSKKLGMVTKFLWSKPLLRLHDQVEHLDSISESLHLELDEGTKALMAMALEEIKK
jgi:hypothetical protein